MRAFLASARRVAPNMKLLPWVGGLRVGYKRSRAGTIDLGDLGQRQRMVAECRGLMDEGFDGIHVNVEPIANWRRRLPGPAARPARRGGDGDPLPLRHAARSRGARFRAQLLLDRRLLRAHRGLRGPGRAHDLRHRDPDSRGLYRRYVAYAAATVTANLARSHRTRVLVGIPTYDETGLMHR
jgi:hypothetical protein